MVVEGAMDFLPEYDEAYAESVLAEIGDAMMEELGVEKNWPHNIRTSSGK